MDAGIDWDEVYDCDVNFLHGLPGLDGCIPDLRIEQGRHSIYQLIDEYLPLVSPGL